MRYTKHLTLAVCLLFAGCSEPGDSTEPVAIVEEPQELPELKKLEFGRDFVLTDQNGERFDTVTLRGKLIFLFFGYTTCPDACPMTLSKIARVDALLGEIGERVQTVYVSVDPERDTVEKVREYLELLSSENSRLSRLVDNFLTFSRLERQQRFDFSDVDVADVVEESLRAYRDPLERDHCRFEVSVADESVE